MLELILSGAAAISMPEIDGGTFRAIRPLGSTTAIELFVDPAGEILQCDVLYPAASEREVQRTCDPVIGRIVEEPARNVGSDPVHGEILLIRVERGERPSFQFKSDFEISVKRLPDDAERSRVSLVVLMDENGAIADCMGEEGADTPLTEIACSQAGLLQFPVRQGSDGKPVSHVRHLLADFVAEEADRQAD